MRRTTDTAGMPDVRSRRTFLDLEIARRNLTLEMELEFALNFSHSEIRAVHDSFLGMASWHISPLAFLSSSPVAAFCGPNSDNRNETCMAVSWQGREIFAPDERHLFGPKWTQVQSPTQSMSGRVN